MSAAELRSLLFEDSLERRQLNVTLFIAFIIAGVFFYLLVAMKFIPDLGARMLLAAVCVAIISIAGPRWTFPLYFATWFSQGIPAPGLPVTINKMLAGAFLLSWVVAWGRRHFRVPHTPVIILLVIYTIYAVAFGLYLKVPEAPPAIQPAMYMLMMLAVSSYYRKRPEFMQMLGILLFITVAINSIGLLEFIRGYDLFGSLSDQTTEGEWLRINGISKNAIQYAFITVWMIPWALFLHIEAKRKAAKVFAMIGLVLLLAMALLTFNRQTPIIIAGMFILGLPLIRYRYRPVIAAFLVIAATAVAPLVIVKLLGRLENIGGEGKPDASLAIRLDKFIAARHMIADHPVFGIGLTNFKDVWPDYRVPGEMYIIHYERVFKHHVDLGYVQLLTETGFVGFSFFLLIVLFTFRLWRKTFVQATKFPDTFHRNALAAAFMGFVQLGMSLFLQDTFFIPRTFLLFALLLALVTMVEDERRRLSVSRTA
ncbi:O-antigen ligase family protein [bacterium]|nr:O-antigen ligase family protein [bacterium]